MEKKFKLKEEAKKYINPKSELIDAVETIHWWLENTDYNEEALEEVEERIKLELFKAKYGCDKLRKSNFGQFKKREKDLCELILNAPKETQDALIEGKGLFTIEQIGNIISENTTLDGGNYTVYFEQQLKK